MTLQQINYLLTIAECSSMNKAAEKLFIAQPTLTGAVREVEKEIGISVFHRTHRGVTPTVEGEEFLLRIRRVYQQYEEVMESYGDDVKCRRKFAVSMQHYSFAVNAFIRMAKHYDSNQFDLALRETKTIDVINDVSTLKSEIGIIYICDTNQRVITKLLKEHELDFTPLIECPASVYLARSHPLAGEKELTVDQLDPYPCLSFEQGGETDIYFAEEIMIEHAYQKTVKATDRATMMNLMEGLNGYTLCSSIYSEKLSGDQFLVIPFKSDEDALSTMTIGYITKKNWELSSMGRQFLDEIEAVLDESREIHGGTVQRRIS
ncbi:MAG: LysR family transcriptional regulator [Oscillospiraceae bacterium]|nr:LysR family transcriptional regulator [Oscillospiraceae bacterium]